MRLTAFTPYLRRWSLPAIAALIALAALVALPDGPQTAQAQSDVTEPVLVLATVSANRLTLNFNEDLDIGSAPAGSAFEVFAVTGTGNAATSRTLNGTGTAAMSARPFARVVKVSLDGSVRHGDRVTVRYTPPAQNPLRDTSGNAAESFWRGVRNNTPASTDTAPPTFASAEVSKTTLKVTFNENLDIESGTAGGAFSVSLTRGGNATTIAGTGKVLTGEFTSVDDGRRRILVPNKVAQVTLGSAVRKGETVTVSYTKPSQFPLQDGAGNAAATFTGRVVTNNTPPAMATRVEMLSNGSNYNQVSLTFDERLRTTSVPTASSFTVTSYHSEDHQPTLSVTGTPSISNSSDQDRSTVTLTLEGPLQISTWVTVEYTAPTTGGRLRNTAGDAVPSFTITSSGTGMYVSCVDTGTWVLLGSGYFVNSGIPCDMGKPGWSFGGDGSIVWSYTETNPAPLVDQPVRSVHYVAPERPDHRVVVGDDGDCYREERVSGRWQRSVSYGTGAEACRQASWNAYHRAYDRFIVNPADGTFPSGTPPAATILSSAAMEGKTLTLTFNQPLDESSRPAPSAFTVTVNNARRSVASDGVAISGRTVTLTLNLTSPVFPTDTVRVRYIRPSTNRLLGANGIAVQTSTDRAATNNTLATLLQSAAVNGKKLTLTFDRTLDTASQPAPSAFTITVNDARRNVASGGVAISGTTVTLTLSSAVAATDTVKARYTRPSRNPLQGANSAPVLTFTDQAVTNNTVNTVFQSAAVDGGTLTLTFNQSLDAASKPAPGAFHVTVNDARRDVATDGVAISGANVTLTLASAVSDTDTVKVRYTMPSTNPLQGSNGLAVETFTDQGVTNNTGVLWRATLTAGPSQQEGNGCRTGSSTLCSTALTDDDFTTGGTDYTVLTLAAGVHSAQGFVELELDQEVPTTWTLTVGDNDGLDVSATHATRSNGNKNVRWFPVLWGIGNGDEIEVSLKAPLPAFSSAAVEGATLTMTFDQSLDTASTPAPGAFHVTVNDARRDVADGGVAISDQTVTLTLASAVADTDTVMVRYTQPSTNPLRGVHSAAVSAFPDQAVTNNTPAQGNYWSATLTLGNVGFTLGCSESLSDARCSSLLTDNDFMHGGQTYRVTFISLQAFGAGWAFQIKFDSALPQSLRDTAVVNVGTTSLSLANANYDDGAAAPGWAITSSWPGWTAGQTVSLQLTEGSGTSAGLTAQEQEQVPAVSVTGVSVVSDPGADQTYGIGDTIRVQVTFNQLVVDVDTSGGTPRLKIDMDPAEWGEKWASYASGSGTASLIFTHTVVEPNYSTQGIAVLESTLELNGGTIQSDGEDADLSHTGLAHDAEHKVDWQTQPDGDSTGGASGDDGGSGQGGGDEEQSAPATVSEVEVTSSPASGDSYGGGETISVTLTFSEAVDVSGTPRLKIDMDPAEWGEKWVGYASGSGSTTLVFTHTVVEPNISTQGIAVLENSLELNGGTIQSDGEDADLSHTGLAHDANHKVDWQQSPPTPTPSTPTVTGVKITSDPGSDDTYGPGDVIRISVTFSEAVDVTGTPQLTIDMDPAEWGAKQASYASGSGSTTLVFTHTVVEPNYSTQGIAVLANTLQLNGGDIESSASDTDADLSHTGLAHDADHKVDWQQSDGGGAGS